MRLKKKKNKKFTLLFYFLFLSILSYFLYNNIFYYKNFFEIPMFENKYYKILTEVGGKKIPDYGINLLENKITYNLNNDSKLNLKNVEYSIQLYASYSTDEINSKIDYFSDIKSINNNNLFIGELDSDFGRNFLILYNNYEKRELAENDCIQLKYIGIKCLVINLRNL